MSLPLRFRWLHCLAVAAALPAVSAPPTLVSVRSPEIAPAITGSGASSGGVFVGPPADSGRYVVFLSGAGDLVAPSLPGGTVNVFRRDRVDLKTELLSVTTSGGVGRRPVLGFSVTPNGNRMAFAWASEDPPAGDTNAWEDVYLRDLAPGLTRLVSVRSDGTGAGNGPSGSPEISADGRFVVFESLATDLVTDEDTNRWEDVFLRNLETGVTERISSSPSGLPGERPSLDPMVAGDGSRVVFRTESTDLAPLTGYGTDLLVWRRGGGALERVTLPLTLPGPALRSPLRTEGAVLSADGSILAFAVTSGGPSSTSHLGIWWMDLNTGDLRRASGTLTVAGGGVPEGPSLSADGRTLVFTALLGEPVPTQPQVRVWTPENGLQSMEELRTTVPPATGEPSVSFRPELAPDAGSVLFFTDQPMPDAGVTDGGVTRLYHRMLVTGLTRLIADGEVVFAGEISADGQAVSWETSDPVLEPGDANQTLDVLVTRLDDERREVISLIAPSAGSVAAWGISTGGHGLSDDGLFLGFFSTAADLVAGDTNGLPDGFVFTASTSRNHRVTAPPGGAPLVARVREMVLSRSGRFAAFVTASTGWTDGDTNGFTDVYVRDLVLGTTVLASARDGTDQSLDLAVDDIHFSGDGSRVSFRASSPASSRTQWLYLRDLKTRRTTLINAPAQTGSSAAAGSHDLSSDGRTLLFSNGFPGVWRIHREDFPALIPVEASVGSVAWLSPDGRTVAWIPGAAGAPGLRVWDAAGGEERVLLRPPLDAIRDVVFSADGSVLTYVRRSDPAGPPAGNPWQVWAMAVATGDEDLISATPSGRHGSGDSREPQASADGRFIVYRTEAADLVPGGDGVAQDIVVHDRYLGVNRRLSATADGSTADNRSSRPEISGDGRMAAFTSAASDLVPGDGNGFEDVFLTAIPQDPAPDEDRDGLPDGWEEDRFGTHSRDGTGDADGDGLNDAGERAAGTSPTDAASRWQVRLQSDGGARRLQWRGAAGVQYRLERAGTLSGDWTASGSWLPGYEGIMSVPLDDGSSAGFFRVAVSRP